MGLSVAYKDDGMVVSTKVQLLGKAVQSDVPQRCTRVYFINELNRNNKPSTSQFVARYARSWFFGHHRPVEHVSEAEQNRTVHFLTPTKKLNPPRLDPTMRVFICGLALLGLTSAQILDVTPPVVLIAAGNQHRIAQSTVSVWPSSCFLFACTNQS